MSKIYLVAFETVPVALESVAQFLDSRSEILDWQSSMLGSAFVVTNADAAELRDLLRTGPFKRFIVAEVNPGGFDTNVSGWLPRAAWDFIKRRQPAK